LQRSHHERSRRKVPYRKIGNLMWEIPKDFQDCMNVPGRIYADEYLIKDMSEDRTLNQCANVACLPGLYKFSVTLPDGHEGYGFPIGGVAASDRENGAISPGGVGYDINCGVRLIRTSLERSDVETKIQEILNVLFKLIPSGLGSRGKIRLTQTELDKVITDGVEWAINNGYGWKQDISRCEENGCMTTADPDKISDRAKKRGIPQLGSLGSGNHFLEIQSVDQIYDDRIAKAFGIFEKGQITVMVHTGSRGFGHQICTDYLRIMERAVRKYNLSLPQRELAFAPASSREADDYFAAMSGAANFAWTNRQMITHWAREAFENVLNRSADQMEMEMAYDVAHNIAKIEEHEIDKRRVKVFTHRKGATRAFPADRPEIPTVYRSIGQPVLIPGTMGTASYLLVGSEPSMELSFGSTAHGAGRVLSRTAAKKRFRSGTVIDTLKSKGITVRAASPHVVSEEAPGSYKDIDRVAKVSHELGIARLVARMIPIGVTKG